MQLKKCCLCGQSFEVLALFPVDLLKPSIFHLIGQHHRLKDHDYICQRDLGQYYKKWRKMQIEQSAHIKTLSELGLKSFDETLLRAKNFDELEDVRLTFGQRLSDRLTSFGGSWSFIISFGVFIILWMGLNSYILFNNSFDPYPYILLNLILSCLAAIQAPVIIMSQKRQESRDRMRAELDYHINLQAGLEIRDINAKIDHIGRTLWERSLSLEGYIIKTNEKNINS
jgi:uncharacterized membrane protein